MAGYGRCWRGWCRSFICGIGWWRHSRAALSGAASATSLSRQIKHGCCRKKKKDRRSFGKVPPLKRRAALKFLPLAFSFAGEEWVVARGGHEEEHWKRQPEICP